MSAVETSSNRVQHLKARFENFGGERGTVRDDLSVVRPRPHVFQRSKTSLQLSSALPSKTRAAKSQSVNVNGSHFDDNSKKLIEFARHLEDSRRASIKRSPAFRSNGRHKNVQRTSSTPPMAQVAPKQPKQQVFEAIQQDINLTDTLKKALSQPLPTGPPPRKPPRAFETAHIANGAKIEAIVVNRPSVRQVASDKISTFVDQNFLGCFTCASKDPLYDLVPFEPIYMEPFSHLRDRRRSSGGSECREKHDHDSANGDLHYMCTSISGSYPTNGATTSSSAGGGTSSEDNLSNDEKSLNSFTTYDQINLLVDAAFNEINQLSDEMEAADEAEKAERKRAQIKLTRTLTEKRKDYVRRTVTNRDKYRKSVYGTVHGSSTFKLTDIATEAGVDASEIVPISERVNKFKEMIEASAKKEPLSPRTSASDGLFQCCLLAGFNISSGKPYIKWKFPASAPAPQNIEEMIFPSKDLLYQDASNQNFSLIFTDLDGIRSYGFCRRILPENSEVFLPLAYCMVTQNLSPDFYFAILTEIETRHGQSDAYITAMLKNLQPLSLPGADQTLVCELPELPKPKAILTHPKPKRLSLEASPKWLEDSVSRKSGSEWLDAAQSHLSIRRPKDLRLEGSIISELHHSLGPELLISVFGTLLLERKVIFYSSNINRLSSCILALQMSIYPFYWQYPIITVLPDHLMDICQAPVPIIIGCLRAPPVASQLEDGIVVNLDAKQMVQKCGDENTILPEELRQSLLMSLELVDMLDQGRTLSNVLIAEAFLRFFVELLAGFDAKSYNRDSFIESQSSPSVKLFLEWFTETAMFRHFINTQQQQTAKSPIDYGLFNAKVRERSSSDTTKTAAHNMEMIIRNCKIINKRSKTFKDRFKHFFSSSS